MKRELGTILKWLGRALVLAAVYVLASSLFFPSGVQALNGVTCDDGYELSNQRVPTSVRVDDPALELSCVSPQTAVDATKEVALVVVGLVAAGGVLFAVRKVLLRPEFHRPEQLAHR